MKLCTSPRKSVSRRKADRNRSTKQFRGLHGKKWNARWKTTTKKRTNPSVSYVAITTTILNAIITSTIHTVTNGTMNSINMLQNSAFRPLRQRVPGTTLFFFYRSIFFQRTAKLDSNCYIATALSAISRRYGCATESSQRQLSMPPATAQKGKNEKDVHEVRERMRCTNLLVPMGELLLESSKALSIPAYHKLRIKRRLHPIQRENSRYYFPSPNPPIARDSCS